MYDNQASRQDRGYRTAYEDRTYEIQRHIWRLQDEYERLLAASQRLYARLPAASQRLHASCEHSQEVLDQLIATICSTTNRIRHFIAESVRAVEDWKVAIDQYRLREDTSSWAQVQLNHHAAFLADPSLAPPLDVRFRQLLQVYRNIQDQAEALIIQKTTRALDHVQLQASPSGSSAPSHNDGNGRLVGRATIWSARPEPSHNDGNGHLTGDATLTSPSAAYVPKSPPPDTATATLYRPALQSTPAHSQRDASTASRAAMSRSAAAVLPTTAQPTADKHHRLQQQFQSATHPMPAGGRGSETSASGPLRTGADGRPLKASTTPGTQGPAATPIDFKEAVMVCPLCSQDHQAVNCTKYPTIYMRIRRAMKLGLCSLCLQESHRSESCPSSATYSCPACQQGHHEALCPTKEFDSPPGADRRRTNSTTRVGGQVSDTRHPLRVNPVRRGDSLAVRESTVSESVPPSAQLSSTSNLNENPREAWKKEERTTPKGRLGTIRPTTTTTHESVSQQGASVLADGLLLDDHHLLPERRSPRIENVQFPEVLGTLECRGNRSPDRVPREGRLHAEKVSSPPISRRRHHDTVVSLVTPDIDRDVIQFATQPAVHRPTHSHGDMASAESASKDPPACSPPPSRELAVILEGIKTAAWNPSGGHFREVTIVLDDSASTTTCISPQLVRDMKLDRLNTRPFKANTSGSSTPTAFEASTVTIVLGTDGREPLHLHATTAPIGFPPLRIAPIDREHLPALRTDSLAVPVTQEQPDILIGQDHAHLFERTTLPRLPHGFAAIGTIMGTVLSGLGRVAAVKIPKVVPSLSEPNEVFASPNDATLHRTGSNDAPPRPNDATLHRTGSKDVPPSPNDATLHPTESKGSPARRNDATLRLTASSNVLARQNDATLHLTTPPVPLLQVSTPSTEPTAPPSLHTDGSDVTTVSKPEPSHTDGKGREPSTTKAPAPSRPGDENAACGPKPEPSDTDGKGLDPPRNPTDTRYMLSGQLNRSGGHNEIRWYDHRPPTDRDQWTRNWTRTHLPNLNPLDTEWCVDNTSCVAAYNAASFEPPLAGVQYPPSPPAVDIQHNTQKDLLDFSPRPQLHVLPEFHFDSLRKTRLRLLMVAFGAQLADLNLEEMGFKPEEPSQLLQKILRDEPEHPPTQPILLYNSYAYNSTSVLCTSGCLSSTSTKLASVPCCKLPAKTPSSGLQDAFEPPWSRRESFSSLRSRQEDAATTPAAVKRVINRIPRAPPAMSHASNNELLDDNRAVYQNLDGSDVDSERDMVVSIPRAEAQRNRRSATPEPSHNDGGGRGAAESDDRAQNRSSVTSEPSHNDGNEGEAEAAEHHQRSSSAQSPEPSHNDGGGGSAESMDTSAQGTVISDWSAHTPAARSSQSEEARSAEHRPAHFSTITIRVRAHTATPKKAAPKKLMLKKKAPTTVLKQNLQTAPNIPSLRQGWITVQVPPFEPTLPKRKPPAQPIVELANGQSLRSVQKLIKFTQWIWRKYLSQPAVRKQYAKKGPPIIWNDSWKRHPYGHQLWIEHQLLRPEVKDREAQDRVDQMARHATSDAAQRQFIPADKPTPTSAKTVPSTSTTTVDNVLQTWEKLFPSRSLAPEEMPAAHALVLTNSDGPSALNYGEPTPRASTQAQTLAQNSTNAAAEATTSPQPSSTYVPQDERSNVRMIADIDHVLRMPQSGKKPTTTGNFHHSSPAEQPRTTSAPPYGRKPIRQHAVADLDLADDRMHRGHQQHTSDGGDNTTLPIAKRTVTKQPIPAHEQSPSGSRQCHHASSNQLHATAAAQQQQDQRTCPFCSHPHLANDCGRYASVNQRLRRSQKLRLCLCCLLEGHQNNSCPRKTTDSCTLCGSDKHHRAICRADVRRTRSRTLQNGTQGATRGSTGDPKRPDSKRHPRKTLKGRSDKLPPNYQLNPALHRHMSHTSDLDGPSHYTTANQLVVELRVTFAAVARADPTDQGNAAASRRSSIAEVSPIRRDETAAKPTGQPQSTATSSRSTTKRHGDHERGRRSRKDRHRKPKPSHTDVEERTKDRDHAERKRPEPSHNDGKGSAAQNNESKRPEPSHNDGKGAAAQKQPIHRARSPPLPKVQSQIAIQPSSLTISMKDGQRSISSRQKAKACDNDQAAMIQTKFVVSLKGVPTTGCSTDRSSVKERLAIADAPRAAYDPAEGLRLLKEAQSRPKATVEKSRSSSRHSTADNSARATLTDKDTTATKSRSRRVHDPMLKDAPIRQERLPPPTLEEIKSYVRHLFRSQRVPGEDRLATRVDSRKLRTQEMAKAQPSTVQVTHGCDLPWDPARACRGHDQDKYKFHLPLNHAKIIGPRKRWADCQQIRDSDEYQEILNEVLESNVATFGQTILLKYACRLRRDNQRVANVLKFIRAVVMTEDHEEEIPRLLHKYQPLMTDKATRAWPDEQDWERAAWHWVCYCPDAYKYLYDRLSGPAIWNTGWLQNANTPQGCRDSIKRNMVNRASQLFDDLRHRLYKQYGLPDIKAAINNQQIIWERFDADPEKRVDIDQAMKLKHNTICFVDQTTYDAFHENLASSVRMIVFPTGDANVVYDFVSNYYPTNVVRRVLFWLGRDYIRGEQTVYRDLAAELCHLYTAHFGNVEQLVVLPPYMCDFREAWIAGSLAFFVQREKLVPFARVILDPLDLQLWEADGRYANRPLSDLTQLLSTTGRYLTEDSIRRRRENLSRFHDIDLWTITSSQKVTPARLSSTITSATTTRKPITVARAAPNSRAAARTTAAAPDLGFTMPKLDLTSSFLKDHLEMQPYATELIQKTAEQVVRSLAEQPAAVRRPLDAVEDRRKSSSKTSKDARSFHSADQDRRRKK